MDLSLLTFFFPPPITLRPNPSTAESKLNLFLCFASPFLPFRFQIAKKTYLRWREGRKEKRDGACCLCRDAFVICMSGERWAGVCFCM